MSTNKEVPPIDSLERIGIALEKIVRELNRSRNLKYPLFVPAWPAIKNTVQTGKDLTNMTTFITFETTVRALPAKEGRNADIAKGLFSVIVDGVVSAQHDVVYNLETREPLGPVLWRAPKGSSVQLRLQYVDDDGNLSAAADTQFGVVSDTIAPDAPTEVGVTRTLAEVTE